jgi:Uncharacterized conserved protein (DUF2075)
VNPDRGLTHLQSFCSAAFFLTCFQPTQPYRLKWSRNRHVANRALHGVDTRSSYCHEDVATEFQAQGLELDWVCVVWDGDLRNSEGAWQYHSFLVGKGPDGARAQQRGGRQVTELRFEH